MISGVVFMQFAFVTRAAAFLSVTAVLMGSPSTMWAYTPEHPDVQRMVASGLKYLDKIQAKGSSGSDGEELGRLCLIAKTLIANGRKESHPVVQLAIEACQQRIASDRFKKRRYALGVYSDFLACIFLLELENPKYSQDIDAFLKFLADIQTPGGAWAYDQSNIGDTSQTQYGVLTIWTAKHHKHQVPNKVAVDAMNWLLRVQDPAGGWAYNGIDNNSYQRTGQGGAKLSLTAASLGSVYILADRLNYKKSVKDKVVTELPPPLKKIPKEGQEVDNGAPVPGVDLGVLNRATIDGNKWLDANIKFPGNPTYNAYYMYALERCMGFRELAEGNPQLEPAWYNDGVDYLKKRIKADGSMPDEHGHLAPEIDTAFSVLFLTRSTQKAIQQSIVKEGSLKGGRGLPGDTTNMKMKNGRVVAAPPAKSFEDLMSMLDDPGNEDMNLIESFPELIEIKDDPEQYKKNVTRLRRMASHESYAVRLVAIKTLGRARDLDNVPTLVYGLTDPDWRVVKEARDALRFVSRKIDGFGLNQSTEDDERRVVVRKWKDWYRKIRPNAPAF